MDISAKLKASFGMRRRQTCLIENPFVYAMFRINFRLFLDIFSHIYYGDMKNSSQMLGFRQYLRYIDHSRYSIRSAHVINGCDQETQNTCNAKGELQ